MERVAWIEECSVLTEEAWALLAMRLSLRMALKIGGAAMTERDVWVLPEGSMVDGPEVAVPGGTVLEVDQDVYASYLLMEQMVKEADGYAPCGGPYWFGWALRTAYLRGLADGRRSEAPK